MRTKPIVTLLIGGFVVSATTLALVPVLFEDVLAEKATRVVSRAIGSEVTVQDADLGLWRRFPRVDVGLTGVKVAGSAPFAEHTFLEVDRVEVGFDLLDLVRGTYTAREVGLQHPVLHAVSGEGDTSNFAFGTSAPASEDAGNAVSLRIERLDVEDMTLRWTDREGGLEVLVEDVDLTGRGAVDGEQITFDTSTQIAELSVTAADETWVHALTLEARGDALYALDTGALTLRDVDGSLNALPVALDARIEPTDTAFDVELDLTAPEATTGELISLIPPTYRGELDAMQTTGTVQLALEAAGRLDAENDDYPELSGSLELVDGSYTTEGLPGTAEDLALSARFSHPQGPLDGTRLDVDRAHFRVEDSRFDATAVVTQPLSDALVTLGVDADLDLASLARTFPVEGFDGEGRLTLDLAAHGRQSALTGLDTDALELDGTLVASGLTVETDLVPLPVQVRTLEAAFDGRTTELRDYALSFGNTSLRGEGRLTDLFGYVLEGAVLGGTVSVDADTFDLGPFLADDGEADAAAGTTETGVLEVPEELDLLVDLSADRVLLEPLVFGALDGTVRLERGVLGLEGLGLDVVGGRAVVSGTYEALSTERAAVDLDLDLERAQVADATRTFTSLQRILPTSLDARGAVGGDLSIQAELDGDLALVPTSLQADGTLRAAGVTLHPEILQSAATRLGREDLADVQLGGGRLAFSVTDGSLRLQPTALSLGSLAATVGGTVGVADQALDLTLDTELAPRALPSGLTQALPSVVPDRVPLSLGIGGTVLKPSLGLELGDVLAGVGNAVGERLDDAVADVRERTDAWLDEARAQADALLARAERQADRLRQEADTRAEQLVDQAGSNPLVAAGAKEAARQARKVGDRAAEQVLQEARQQADALVQQAKDRRDDALAEARGR